MALVALACAMTAATPAAAGTSRKLAFAGYGASRWGQTVAQTEHALGVTFNCSGSSCGCPDANPSLPIRLAFSKGRLSAAWTYDQSVHTTRGVHVGSSAASVRKQYPNVTKKRGPIGGSETTYLLAHSSAGAIAFELSGSTVSGLDAGPTASSFTKELCS